MGIDPVPDTPLGTKVLVSPASGDAWLGEVVDLSALPPEDAGVIEVPFEFVLVRCTDRMSATGIAQGHIYLVLRRYIG